MRQTFLIVLAGLCAVNLSNLWGFAQALAAESPSALIVKFKASQGAKGLDSKLYQTAKPLVKALNLYLVKVKPGSSFSTGDALTSLRHDPSVVFAQFDHKVKLRSFRDETTPNDPEFAKQWNLSSPQTHVDISATEAWKLGKGGKDAAGNDIVVAIVDGGMDVNHPDLVENLWVNAKEIPGNGIDDDGNGFIDDIHGWNSGTDTGTVPSTAHGTHVAGIAGARGNNGKGVVGVNWNVKIMAVAAPGEITSTVIKAYGYVLAQKKLWLETHGAKGANVVSTNSSFGMDDADCTKGEYPAWNDMYESMGKVGILAAAATANNNVNVDVTGDVPTGCASSYIVSVTNTNSKDEKYPQAGYGLKTIALGAPGTAIYSTIPGGFGTMTGTSMATPHLAGAIAFLHSVASADFQKVAQSDPARAALILKGILLRTVDKLPSLAGITISGGRLNLAKAGQAIAAYH